MYATHEASVFRALGLSLGVALTYKLLGLEAFCICLTILAIWCVMCVVKHYAQYRHELVQFVSSMRVAADDACERYDAPIANEFTSLEQVSAYLRRNNLETCQLVLGIDCTKSNQVMGEHTFRHAGRRVPDLHTILPGEQQCHQNPYQYVISTLGRTLLSPDDQGMSFDDDGKIPAFIFGDALTADHSVRSLNIDSCADGAVTEYQGFEGVLEAYTRLMESGSVRMSGPTSFAPIIRKTMDIVRDEGGYHILIIITDGQVIDKDATAQAIVDASELPISILVVGVGDGPFDTMETYDDYVQGRKFDNLQFVAWKDHVGGKNRALSQNSVDARFALDALQEIPRQMQIIKKLGLMTRTNTRRHAHY